MLNATNLSKSFPINDQKVKVLDDINIQINKGEFVVIFGPNGCGKTTLLNLIAGLDNPDSGEIHKQANTKMNFIFQNYREALLPWLKVIDNIALPLKLQGLTKEQSHQKVVQLVDDLELKIDLNLFPYQLSGGQQQLAAVLRGIISSANLFIMDEPFSSLDYNSTLLMEQKLMDLWAKFKFSVLFVTHAAGEAVLLADRIIIMGNNPGQIVSNIKVGLPRPRNYKIITTPEFNNLKEQVINTCFQYSSNY